MQRRESLKLVATPALRIYAAHHEGQLATWVLQLATQVATVAITDRRQPPPETRLTQVFNNRTCNSTLTTSTGEVLCKFNF